MSAYYQHTPRQYRAVHSKPVVPYAHVSTAFRIASPEPTRYASTVLCIANP